MQYGRLAVAFVELLPGLDHQFISLDTAKALHSAGPTQQALKKWIAQALIIRHLFANQVAQQGIASAGGGALRQGYLIRGTYSQTVSTLITPY